VLALALSGLVTALTRVQSWSALATGYGVVVLLKVGALGVLVVLGARQRRGLAAGPRVDRRTFVALAGTELLVMALVFALAAGLAGTPPPA
jgi:putative copper export protein